MLRSIERLGDQNDRRSILANPQRPRRRQVTMTITQNPLRSTIFPIIQSIRKARELLNEN